MKQQNKRDIFARTHFDKKLSKRVLAKQVHKHILSIFRTIGMGSEPRKFTVSHMDIYIYIYNIYIYIYIFIHIYIYVYCICICIYIHIIWRHDMTCAYIYIYICHVMSSASYWEGGGGKSRPPCKSCQRRTCVKNK